MQIAGEFNLSEGVVHGLIDILAVVQPMSTSWMPMLARARAFDPELRLGSLQIDGGL